MKGKTIRVFVVLALLAISGIVIIQVFWFRMAFNNNEQEFNKNLNIALNKVVRGVLSYNNTRSVPPDPVKQIAENYFAVMVNDRINTDVLEHYLRQELSRFNIRQGFEYRIFDCASEKLMYGGFIEGADEVKEVKHRELPVLNEDNYYFTVYFPDKTTGIIKGMHLWIFSSAVLFIVVVFFSYSLFVILKQKRWSEMQRDFINNMTHEIKTPVSIISVSAETLKNPEMLGTPQRLVNYATIILAEAARLKAQVERVLSVAEGESGIRLNREKTDVHGLIREVTETIRENLSAREMEVTYSLGAAKAVLNADRFHLHNVISNLVDNAIKYSNGKVELAIRSSNPANGLLQIEIEDHGIGISREHQKKIFDKFYRVPTGNVHNAKGFGIGLNYVQLVARAHKGNIKVKSEPGRGSIFVLTLPLA